MREIKFRQPIRTKSGLFTQWFYWGYIEGQWIEQALHLSGIDTRTESQQFTGLLDKNGKEIYEGDIVREHQKFFIPKDDESKDMDEIVLDSIGEIRFDNGCFILFSQTKEQREVGGSSTSCGFGRLSDQVSEGEEYWIEVIGNIYENPELLKP